MWWLGCVVGGSCVRCAHVRMHVRMCSCVHGNEGHQEAHLSGGVLVDSSQHLLKVHVVCTAAGSGSDAGKELGPRAWPRPKLRCWGRRRLGTRGA